MECPPGGWCGLGTDTVGARGARLGGCLKRGGDFYLATRGDFYLATRGEFFTARYTGEIWRLTPWREDLGVVLRGAHTSSGHRTVSPSRGDERQDASSNGQRQDDDPGHDGGPAPALEGRTGTGEAAQGMTRAFVSRPPAVGATRPLGAVVAGQRHGARPVCGASGAGE
jgi:hypothetical protein